MMFSDIVSTINIDVPQYPFILSSKIYTFLMMLLIARVMTVKSILDIMIST